MSQAELSALIIANIQDLDGAAYHVENVLQPEVGAAIDDKHAELVRAHGWNGEADWDSEELWTAPKTWQLRDDDPDEYVAHFEFVASDEQSDESDSYRLTQLVGKGHARLGFRWVQNTVPKRIWKKAVGSCSRIIQELRALGFEYRERDGTFFIPVVLDANTLSEAVADEEIGRALAPFEAMFDKMQAAAPIFDQLRAEAPIG